MKALGIDIGTTSICLVCYEEGKERLPYVLHRPNAFLAGSFRQDPEAIVAKVFEMLREAQEAGMGADLADAVGISSQMHGILYVNEEGMAVSDLYTWKDESGKLSYSDGRSYEEYLREETGFPMYSGYGTVTHFYLEKNGLIPGRAVKLAGIGDYLAMRLTGRKTPLTDESMAAGFGGYDLQQGAFALDILRRAGVDTSFYPALGKAGEPAGEFLGTPVSCAFGDNQASFLGARGDAAGRVSVNVGTGSQVSLFDSRYIPAPGAEIRPFFHKGYLYVGASLNGGKVYEKLAGFIEETVFAFTGKKIEAYDRMRELGEEKKETALIVTPSLYGSRGDGGEAGRIGRLTEESFHPADLIRAYVKGMAEELYRMYEAFPEVIREGRKEIVASGNGIRKNPLMAEETGKRFGMPVLFSETEEEAAAGAARAALELVRERNLI